MVQSMFALRAKRRVSNIYAQKDPKHIPHSQKSWSRRHFQ